MLLSLLVCDADLEKELGELKDVAQYVMDLYILQEECDNPPRQIPCYRLRPIHFGQ
jgi:hypothetical protein